MMKTEFLAAIADEIGFLPPYKRRQVMAHFSSLFTGCDADLDIIEKLGTPEDALREYLTATKKTSKIPKPLFLAALLILSPFIVRAAMVALVLSAVLTVFAIVILLAIPLTGIALWLDGIEIIRRSIPLPVILADKLWQIGIGCMQFAAGIVIILLMYKLYSKLIPWILGRLSALYHRIEKRRTK